MPDKPRTRDGRFVRTPESAARDAEAARLRGRGKSYREIAATLGIDVHRAHEAVQRVLTATVEEPAAEVRAFELDRLDRMWEAALKVLETKHVTVSQGKIVYDKEGAALADDAPVLNAIDRLLRIQERRAKLLGLDAATKTEVSGGVRYEIVGVPTDEL